MKKYIISLICVLFISGSLFGQTEIVEPEDIVLQGTLVSARIVHLDFKNNSRADVYWELKIDNRSNGDMVVKLVKGSGQNQHFEIGEKYIIFKWGSFVTRAMKIE